MSASGSDLAEKRRILPVETGSFGHKTEVDRIPTEVWIRALFRRLFVLGLCRIQSCMVMRGGEKCTRRLRKKLLLYN